MFLKEYTSAIVTQRPDLSGDKLNSPEIHTFLLTGMPNFRRLFVVANILQIAAGFVALVSVSTLWQLANWGTSCKLE
ncbi:MAG: hypothetical protein ACRDAM_03665, partial [Casimicrobium sp.]